MAILQELDPTAEAMIQSGSTPMVEIERRGQPSLLCLRHDTLQDLLNFYRLKQDMEDTADLRVIWLRQGSSVEIGDDVALQALPHLSKIRIATVTERVEEPRTINIAFGDRCIAIARAEVESGSTLVQKAKRVYNLGGGYHLVHNNRTLRDNDDLGRRSEILPWDDSVLLHLIADGRNFLSSREGTGNLVHRKKPVIIIYSNIRRNVAVKLSLPPGEDWTAVYPEPSIRDSLKGRPSVTWHCAVHPVNEGGCLTILGDDVKYSSLFWESKRMTNAGQNSRVNIDLDRSVIGSVATVLESLSNNLRAMSMSDTAATDFMQYWIPALTRIEKAGQYVAIQFVSQEVLNRDTPLVIEPQPDVVTRIFMVFKAVPSVKRLATCTFGHGEPRHRWLDQVNVDPLAFDRSKYRVLEWGGAEIL